MKLAATVVAFSLLIPACASISGRKPAAPRVLAPALIDARLAEADALAARGCYVCLSEAADAYYNLISIASSTAVLTHALENDLMMALRESEMRLPDSGARSRAKAIASRLAAPNSAGPGVASSYAMYFDVLELIAAPPVTGGRITIAEMRDLEAGRKALVDRLAANATASAMGAYFYVAAAVAAGQAGTLLPQSPAILETHPDNLAVQYRLLSLAPRFSVDAAADLIAHEPRFAEVHFLLGQRYVATGTLTRAHQELSAAQALLPDSLAIALALGRLELAFGRYPQAVALFERVLARGPDEAALLGRAIALSYLKRHEAAIADLDQLLRDASSLPGEKYYWRGWNQLALSHHQQAYDDAKTAMNSMANSNLFKLAGMAAYGLSKIPEARGYFESALSMNAAECDALHYLGIIDAAERGWPSAVSRFTGAAACYRSLIESLEKDLASKRADTSGLYASQIDGILANIAEARSLAEASRRNADVASRNQQGP